MRNQRGRYAHKIFRSQPASRHRSGWAVRRFDSHAHSEVPDVILCLCAQGKGESLRIAPHRYNFNEPPAKGHRGTSTISKINGEPKGSHVK